MKLIYVVEVGKRFFKKRYVNNSFVVTGDIQDAKWFYDKETAEMTANELRGQARDLISVLMEEEE